MWLFFTKAGGGAESNLRGLTEMEDSARKLQRTMTGGMVLESNKFREQLFQSYEGVLKINGTFEDITKEVENFSKGMNKVVFLTTDLVNYTENGKQKTMQAAEAMVTLSKSTGIAAGEVGTMVSEFIRLEGSQVKSIERIQKIAKEARMSGLDSEQLIKGIRDNLGKIDSYGFKNGIQGLTEMTKKAQLLRSSVSDIVNFSTVQSFWDPEKAIETAASMSMLGGAVGELTNPFELMNMSINDVGKFQDKMAEMSAKAFKINKETGEIEIDPQSRMRLKEQSELFGKTLEEYTKIGREAFKAQEVVKSMTLTGFGNDMPQESKDLLSSLTEVKGGKLTLDIPGFKTDDLEEAMKSQPGLIESALAQYQEKAKLSDRQIAEQGLTLQESLNKDARIIRDTLLMNMGPDKRADVIKMFQSGIDISTKTTKEEINNAMQAGSNALNDSLTNMQNPKRTTTTQQELDKLETTNTRKTSTFKLKDGDYSFEENKDFILPSKPLEDSKFSEGDKVLSLGKGEIFNFIKEDEAVFAPNLLKNLDILKNSYMSMLNMKETLKNVNSTSQVEKSETKTETVKKVEASGDININVNLTSNGTLSEMISKDSNFVENLRKTIINTVNNKTRFSADKTVV